MLGADGKLGRWWRTVYSMVAVDCTQTCACDRSVFASSTIGFCRRSLVAYDSRICFSPPRIYSRRRLHCIFIHVRAGKLAERLKLTRRLPVSLAALFVLWKGLASLGRIGTIDFFMSLVCRFSSRPAPVGGGRGVAWRSGSNRLKTRSGLQFKFSE